MKLFGQIWKCKIKKIKKKKDIEKKKKKLSSF